MGADQPARPETQESQIRKFLVVSDGSSECLSAARYAALRVRAINGKLVLLAIARGSGFEHWQGVKEQMRREARQDAAIRAGKIAGDLKSLCEVEPEIVIFDSEPLQAVREVVAKDPSIWVLVLGSGPDGKPGPLISLLGKGRPLADRPLAVTVIPHALSDEEVAGLGGGL